MTGCICRSLTKLPADCATQKVIAMKSPYGAPTILTHVTDIDGELFHVHKAVSTNHDFYLWRGWRDNETRRRASTYILTREVAGYLVSGCTDPGKPDLPLTEGVLRQFRERLGIATARDIAYREWQQWSVTPPRPMTDVFGRAYLVCKQVPCKLGIDLAWGTPSVKEVGRNKVGKVKRSRFILTRELADAIKNWEGSQLELASCLPIDRKTVDRMRHALQLDWHDDVIRWWADRIDDLMQMSPDEFAATHGKQMRTVRDQRYAIEQVRHRLDDNNFVKLLSADWSDKKQGVKKEMGAQYGRLQIYRRAWRILKAAGQLKDFSAVADGLSNELAQSSKAISSARN